MATDLELVGRAEPVATLRWALDRAAEGRGRLVVLSGEPGIGKSALTAIAAREAEERGGKVVFGRAWELGEAPSQGRHRARRRLRSGRWSIFRKGRTHRNLLLFSGMNGRWNRGWNDRSTRGYASVSRVPPWKPFSPF
jgi:predicted ATP-dependent serine protease